VFDCKQAKDLVREVWDRWLEISHPLSIRKDWSSDRFKDFPSFCYTMTGPPRTTFVINPIQNLEFMLGNTMGNDWRNNLSAKWRDLLPRFNNLKTIRFVWGNHIWAFNHIYYNGYNGI
jgi:hypothetical protein